MKNTTRIAIWTVALGFLFYPGTAQNRVQELFDRARMEKELEVMKGIIQTSLSFAGQEVPEFRDWGRPQVEALYLYGQGAVFSIQAPGLGRRLFLDLGELSGRLERIAMEALDPELLEIQLRLTEDHLRRTERILGRGRGSAQEIVQEWEYELAPIPPSPPAPPSPPPPPSPPSPPAGETPRFEPAPVPAPSPDTPERRRQLEERRRMLEERLEKRKAELKEQRERLLRLRQRLEEELVQVAAQHGDSLTQVRPEEFVNFVLASGPEAMALEFGVTAGTREKPEKSQKSKEMRLDGGASAGTRVLSVRKSDILAYKNGSLGLEQFKDRFLRY